VPNFGSQHRLALTLAEPVNAENYENFGGLADLIAIQAEYKVD
jgi:hypothetical protein